MRALVIVHEPGSEPVLVGQRLERRGFDLVEVLVAMEMGDPTGSAAALGDPTDYDVIVPMGSTFSLTAPGRLPWIHDELEFLRRADAQGVPVFGVCFGGQALAVAHGGRVVRSDRPQIGWWPLDPLGDAPLAGPWMQWHYDRFEPPMDDPDLDVLAADEFGVQAFALRRNLAVQFHPEVTPDHVGLWVSSVPADELRSAGTEPARLVADAEANLADVRRRTNALVDWFLSDIATR